MVYLVSPRVYFLDNLLSAIRRSVHGPCWPSRSLILSRIVYAWRATKGSKYQMHTKDADVRGPIAPKHARF